MPSTDFVATLPAKFGPNSTAEVAENRPLKTSILSPPKSWSLMARLARQFKCRHKPKRSLLKIVMGSVAKTLNPGA
jgi:hypothetical protein